MIQHHQLDGPFSIVTAWTTGSDGQGHQIQIPSAFKSDIWMVTKAFFDANKAQLTPFLSATLPLQRVWANDSPTAPVWTVTLTFPNNTAAEAILKACGARDVVAGP